MKEKTKKINSNLTSHFAHHTFDHRGITLIALIITIIVMLILVGVAINKALNGGLIGKGKETVSQISETEKAEQRARAITNAAMNRHQWVYTLGDDKIPIPAGFAPTEIEGENSIEDGLVIIDSEGNEFVWIPCSLSNYDGATFQDGWKQNSYTGTGASWTDSQTETGKKSLEKLEERKNNGELTENGVGFYVARYEAGIPEEAPFYGNSEGAKYYLAGSNGSNGTTGKNTKEATEYAPVSKKGYPAWNFISQINAKTVSQNMYPGHSYLIDSHAWNYICKNIFQDRLKIEINKDCSTWGNYRDNKTTNYEELNVLYAVHEYNNGSGWTKYADGDITTPEINAKYHKGTIPANTAPNGAGTKRLELATGASEDFKAYNIYDMAGNVDEWTTETGTRGISTDNAQRAISRGGTFSGVGSSSPVVFANTNGAPSYGYVNFGFRVVLYL